jgi:hypothetical protein
VLARAGMERRATQMWSDAVQIMISGLRPGRGARCGSRAVTVELLVGGRIFESPLRRWTGGVSVNIGPPEMAHIAGRNAE